MTQERVDSGAQNGAMEQLKMLVAFPSLDVFYRSFVYR